MFGKVYKLKIKAQKPKQKPREHMHFPSDMHLQKCICCSNTLHLKVKCLKVVYVAVKHAYAT